MGFIDWLLGDLPPGIAFFSALQAFLLAALWRQQAKSSQEAAKQSQALMTQLHQDRLVFQQRHEQAEVAAQRRQDAAISEHKSDHGGIRSEISDVKSDLNFIKGRINGGSRGH